MKKIITSKGDIIVYKVKVTIVIVVYVLLSLFVQQVSDADQEALDELKKLESQLSKDERQMQITIGYYDNIKVEMKTLIDDWRGSKKKVDSNLESALTRGSIAIVGAAAVYFSGGAAAAYAPAIYLAMVGGQDAVEAGSIDLSQYLSAMDSVQSLMDDDALGDIQTAYVNGGTLVLPKTDMDGNQLYNPDGTLVFYEQDAAGYINTYKAYMKKGAAYMGWTGTVEAFFDEVQARNGNVTVGLDSDAITYDFETQLTYRHFPVPPALPGYYWTTVGLPKNFLCGGSCGNYFATPLGDNGNVCEGCRDIYYSCWDYEKYNNAVEHHKLRDCNRKIWQETPDGKVAIDCPHQYRNCVRNVNKHVRPPQATTGTSLCMAKPPDALPYPPQNFSLTPGITTIRLEWTAPAYSGSSAITNYEYKYRRKTIFLDDWTAWSSAGTGFTKTIANLQADTDYEVALCARNSDESLGYSILRSVATNSRDDSDDGDSTLPAVFRPSLSLRYNSSTGSVRLTATASEPIYGAQPYVRFPGDTSKYGTKLSWTGGNSNRTTYALPVNYTFPASAPSGTYKFTLRVYPFNNSGTGNKWGDPVDVIRFVTVE